MHRIVRTFIVAGCIAVLVSLTSCSTLFGAISPPRPTQTTPTAPEPATSAPADPSSSTPAVPVPDETTEASTTGSSQAFLEMTARIAQSQLPMVVDEETTLVSMSAPGNGVLRYEYVLTNLTTADLTPEVCVIMAEAMRPVMLEALINGEDTATLRSLGATLVYSYVGNDAPLDFDNAPMTITLTPADYQ